MNQSPTKQACQGNDAPQEPLTTARATRDDQPAAHVLFSASMDSLKDKQSVEAYRNRVNHILLDPIDLSPVPKVDVDTHIQLTQPTLESHLRAPKPVVLFEDPLQYKTANPNSVTQMSDQQLNQIDEQIDESQNTAIFIEAARTELLKPLISLVISLALIVLIGSSVYRNNSTQTITTITPPMTASHNPVLRTATESPNDRTPTHIETLRMD